MSGYLLDTNVLSEMMRKRPAPSVIERLGQVSARNLYTSVICVTELRYGAQRHPQGSSIWARTETDILPRLQILPLTLPGAVRAGDLLAELTSRGEPIGIEDVLIAATALEGGLTAVTRNLKHFDRIPGLRCESWWEPG